MARDRRLALVCPLLAVNFVACLAAGLVLIVQPVAIPALAGITISVERRFSASFLLPPSWGLRP